MAVTTSDMLGGHNGNNQVTIDEVLLAVNVIVGKSPLADYRSLDGGGTVTIDGLVAVQAGALG